MPELPRLVLDTNALLSGLVNRDSASGRVLQHCQERHALLLMSRPVQVEYFRVLGAAEMLRRNPEITWQSVDLLLRRLRYFGLYFGHVGARFRFERDPNDAPFIELAIEGTASHLVTNDKDLLSLASGHDEAAKRLRQRLPQLQILRAAEFLRELENRVL